MDSVPNNNLPPHIISTNKGSVIGAGVLAAAVSQIVAATDTASVVMPSFLASGFILSLWLGYQTRKLSLRFFGVGFGVAWRIAAWWVLTAGGIVSVVSDLGGLPDYFVEGLFLLFWATLLSCGFGFVLVHAIYKLSSGLTLSRNDWGIILALVSIALTLFFGLRTALF